MVICAFFFFLVFFCSLNKSRHPHGRTVVNSRVLYSLEMEAELCSSKSGDLRNGQTAKDEPGE